MCINIQIEREREGKGGVEGHGEKKLGREGGEEERGREKKREREGQKEGNPRKGFHQQRESPLQDRH